MSATTLVAGLGNPGPRYRGTRHNVGFMLLDLLAQRIEAGGFRSKFSADFVKGELKGADIVLLKPMTYMNRSGESVQKAMHFYKASVEDLLVVHDELDLQFGTVRLKSGGGTAGHKGLASIVSHIGGPGFGRLRIGIGRPKVGRVEDFVLSDFGNSERAELPDVLETGLQALESAVLDGWQTAMNRYNTRN